MKSGLVTVLPVTVVASVLLGISVPLRADVAVFHAESDTTLFEVAPNHNLGRADFFNAGTSGQSGARNRALILFDPGTIPAGSIINGVTVQMQVVRHPTSGLEHSTFGLHRAFLPWDEGQQIPENPDSPGLGAPGEPGEATWNSPGPGWSPGGRGEFDFFGVPSSVAASGLTGDDMLFESTPELIADINLWINQPGTNYGWILVSQSEEIWKTARSFASSESGFGPTLTIDYTPVPEPGTVALLALPVIAIALHSWRRRARS